MRSRERHRELLAINRAIAGAVDEAEILCLVVDRTAAITGATACVLLLAGQDGLARVARSAGVYPVKADELAVPLSEHLDVELRGRLGLKAEDGFAGAPVIGKAGLRGILAIYRKGSQAVDVAADEEVLSAFADQAAIALDHIESKRLLRESEAQSRSILTAMAEGVVMQDATGKIVQCNAAAERILGLSRDQMEGRTSVDPLWRSVHEDGSPFPGEGHPSMVALRTGEAVSNVIMGVHKPDGSLTWISINSEPIRAEPGGPPVAVVTTFADVTSIREAKEEVQASEARLSAVLEGGGDGFVDIDARSGVIFRSPRLWEIAGWPQGSLPDEPESFLDIVHPEDIGRVGARVAALLAGTVNDLDEEYRLRSSKGTWTWVQTRLKVVNWAEGGKPERVAGTVRDISRSKQVEESLRDREARLRAFFQSPGVGIAITAAGYGFVEVNDAFCTMLGYTREELLRVHWQELTHPDDVATDVAEVGKLLSGESEAYSRDKRYIRKDGTVVWVRLSTSCTRRPDRSVESIVAIVKDITARKFAEEALDAAHRQLNRHVTNTPLALIEWDGDYRVTRFTARASDMFGWREDEVLGKRIDEVPWVPEEDWPKVRAVMNDMDSGSRSSNVNLNRNVRKDGRVLHCEWYNSTLYGQDGKLISVFSLVQDVTAREEAVEALQSAQAALQAQQEHLDLAASSGRLGLWDLDLATNTAWRTLQHDRLFGYDELLSTWGPEEAERHVISEDRPIFRRAFDQAFATGRFHYELRIVPAGKPMRWLEATGEVVRDESGKPVRIRGSVADVTDRKEAEERVREAAAYARSLIEASLDPLVTISPEGKITDVNRATEEATGVPRTRMVGTDFADYFTDPERARTGYEKVLADGEVRDYPLTLRHSSGRVIEVVYNSTVYSDAKGKLLGVFAAARDVTDRKKAEEALRASEVRFRALAEEAPIGIYQTDVDGRNVYLNRALQVITGQSQEEAGGTGWNACLHPDDRERVVRELAAAIAAGKVFESEYRFLRSDGTSVLARSHAAALRDVVGTITGYIGVVMDITALKAMEAQLALTSRLAAMGTLVAGVAHEVNNPLAAALADQGLALEVVQEVRERLRGRDPFDREEEGQRLDTVIEELKDAEEGGRRIAQIVKDLSAFGRQGSERTQLRLIDVVNQAMRWLPASVGHVASVKVEDGGAPAVEAAFGQIEQVVVNLVTNAAKATKAGVPGVIIVRVGPGSPGMARMDVTDNGVGIAPAIRDRIFDPFFTTRQVGEGKGMGLGLAVSHTIVTNHRGTLTVESQVGKGSTFRVELPAAPVEA